MENLSAPLLKRYFAGDCTKAERALVETWLAAEEEHADRALQQVVPDAGANLPAVLEAAKKEVWEKTLRQVRDNKAAPGGLGPLLQLARGRARKIKKACLQASAGLSTLILIGFVGQAYYQNQSTTVRTGFGQVERITLPDQTVVYLNGNSQLTYKRFSAGKGREVWLEGEAFFQVRHLARHQKFMVHLSDQLDIEVLGTEFNVSNRKPGKAIVLKSGKIKLNLQTPNRQQHIYLKPGDLVTGEGLAAGSFHKKTVDPEMYYAWIGYKWVLDGTTLGEMLGKLEETYGLKTVVSNKALLDRRASGSIPLPQNNAPALLGDIANLFELTILKKNGVLYLTGK